MANEITELLAAAGSGDELAARRIYERSYDELRRLARAVRFGRASETINTTALVHEAYLKLLPGGGMQAQDRVHFLRIAARAMRQILVDAARRRATRRRGREAMSVAGSLQDDRVAMSVDVVALDTALSELESVSPRQAQVVECRFFAGLSVEETAATLGISPPTVKRDWRVARAFLAHSLGAPPAAE